MVAHYVRARSKRRWRPCERCPSWRCNVAVCGTTVPNRLPRWWLRPAEDLLRVAKHNSCGVLRLVLAQRNVRVSCTPQHRSPVHTLFTRDCITHPLSSLPLASGYGILGLHATDCSERHLLPRKFLPLAMSSSWPKTIALPLLLWLTDHLNDHCPMCIRDLHAHSRTHSTLVLIRGHALDRGTKQHPHHTLTAH